MGIFSCEYESEIKYLRRVTDLLSEHLIRAEREIKWLKNQITQVHSWQNDVAGWIKSKSYHDKNLSDEVIDIIDKKLNFYQGNGSSFDLAASVAVGIIKDEILKLIKKVNK